MGFKFRRRMSLFAVCLIVSGLLSGLLPYGSDHAYAGTGGEIYTVAGGEYGDSGDGGMAVDAELSNLSAVAVDISGNLYIADTDNNKIRKVDTSGRISTVAGTGDYGYSGDDGAAIAAQLRSPSGVAVDDAGNVYIADKYNNRIRKVALDGTISTVAGMGENGYSGDNGPAVEAELSSPSGIAVDGDGNLYIADTGNSRIRKVDTTGIITTVAGKSDYGKFEGEGIPAVNAELYNPSAIAIDSSGNLYIADTYNNRIRKVDANGIISTVAGSSGTEGYSGDGGPAVNAQLNEPEGVTVDGSGNLYIADTDNNRIRKVNPNGIIITIVGTGTSGYSGDGGSGILAQVDGPAGLAMDSSGSLYIADKYNYALRKQLTYIPSSDASLSNITLSSGTLSPVFASDTTDYTVSVVNGVSSIRVTPTTTTSLITVEVNGEGVASGAQSGDITLDVGDNTITLVALAEDGLTTKTYTIIVNRLKSSNANLSQLSLSSGTLSPTFAPNTMNYTANASQSAITVTPTLADPMAAVEVNGTAVANGAASHSIPLAVGSNVITVDVTAQDGTTTKTYTITVTRSISTNADLSGLTLSSGTLSPSFSSATTSYTANVENNINSLTVTPTTADGTATVTVNDMPVASGAASAALPLIVGSNTISVLVTAENNTTKTYTITVTRAASSNADLSDLTISSGDLLPSFVPGTFKTSVNYSVSSVTITPTVSDTVHATVTVSLYTGGGALAGGPYTVTSGTASPTLPLNVGTSTIMVQVTAEDGTAKIYTVTVTRGASNNADLSNLTLSSGTLVPAFGGTYTANVGYTVSSVTVTPTLSDADNSSVTVSVYDDSGMLVSGPHAAASGMASAALPLNVGNNVIKVIVMAQDGSTRTYTVTVTRAAVSSNADLSGLTLSSGMLSPAFEPNTISYTASVDNNVNNVTVTMEKADADKAATTASVYTSDGLLLNGPFVMSSGTAAFLLPLNVGGNEISILVRTQDGTTKTYTVNVTRATSTNADLSGLTLSSGTLSPSFDSATTSYTANVGNNVSSLTVTPTTADSHATMIVNDMPVASGAASAALPLIVGSNTISVLVTAENNTTKTYTITVTRAASSNADLSDLTISSGELLPSFVPGTFKTNVSYPVSSVTVTPTVSDTVHAAVTVSLYTGGGALAGGPYAVTSGTASPTLPLNVGTSTIMVQVTAEDETTKIYTVTVTRGASSNAELSNLTLSSGTLVPAFGGTYTASVGYTVSSVTITPELSDADNSSVTVSVYDDGGMLVSGPHTVTSGTASTALPLNVGNNVIKVLVTAQDGSTRTYIVTVTRAAVNSNADLSGLTLSSGMLSPAFGADTTNYTANVENNVNSLTVTPTVADGHAAVTVNDVPVTSGAASAALPLITGSNEITILVTAQDNTTKTYKVVVTREAPISTGGGGGGGGSAPVVDIPDTNKAVIVLNGQELDPAGIDTGKPFVTLDATPKEGVVIVGIPASILTELAAKNADFYFVIRTPYGSYQVPANLASLISGLPDLLASNKLQAGDVSFRITLSDKSSDKNLQAVITSALPNGKVLGPIVDFHIDVVHTKTGLTVGTADQFKKALTRWIPLPNNPAELSSQLWGAFRYQEATKKLEFVPATMLEQDGVWYAAIQSYTNSVYAVVANKVSFADVEKHWSKSAVELAAAKGLVEGIGGGQFAPDKMVTRAEFTAMLVRTLGRGTSTGSSTVSYSDVTPDAWYFDAVATAQDLGLLDFVSGTKFKPDQPLTREEMASMLAAMIALEKPAIAQSDVSLNGYKDLDNVDASYLENIRLMVKLQIMRGTSEETFSPKGVTTRAEAAVVFIRMLQELGMID